MSVTDVSEKTGLARPTVRRLLLTLEELGYVRQGDTGYSLTTKVLEIGTAAVAAQGLWDIARPHMIQLVKYTGESSSMSQLDGSDIIYMSRVAVPKIIALSVQIGTRFPATAASMGRVLLGDLSPDELDKALDTPSRSHVLPRLTPSRPELDSVLTEVRDQGWALADEVLSLGVRSVAAPVRDSSGRVTAALNVTVHASETSIKKLTDDFLPALLETAATISQEWGNLALLPTTEVPR